MSPELSKQDDGATAETPPTKEEETMEECIKRVMAANKDLTEEAARALCTESQKMEKTMAECIQRKMGADQDLTEEAARALCEKEAKPETSTAARPPRKDVKDMNFIEKITATFEDAIDAKFTVMMGNVEKRFKEIQKDLEDQAVDGIRKGLGIDKDPVVHISDIEKYVRKILLEGTDPGKRTETATDDKPAGDLTKSKTGKLETAEKVFQDLLKKKGAI